MPKDVYQPICSADGGSLYYLGDEGLRTFALTQMPLRGGKPKVLARHVDPGIFALGNRVYFQRFHSKGSDIFSVAVYGEPSGHSNAERWEGRVEGKVSGLSISPDGKFALVTRLDQETSTLIVLRRPL